jgi:CubicO group peptidase (beta-lactamase class C family)
MTAEKATAAIEHLMRRGVADGGFPGAQVYASVGGDVVADVAVGEARLGVPMTARTIVSWQCNTKPVTAVAACQLWERGALDLDAPVVRYMPEFGRHGKEAVTVRHLLTHTAGFAYDPPIATVGRLGWDQVQALVRAATLQDGWVPGAEFRYSAWYGYAALGVLVSRIDGRSFSRYVREEIFEPLGMRDCWVGVDAEHVDSVASSMAFVYDTSGPRPEVPPVGGLFQAKHLDTCSPASGGVGPVRQLGLLWEALRQILRGGRNGILRQGTVQAMVRQGLGHYGLGVMVAPGYFGDWCPMAFGHDGMRSTQAFVDPDNDVVVVAALNGLGRSAAHRRWIKDVGRLVYDSATGQPKDVRPWMRRLRSR